MIHARTLWLPLLLLLLLPSGCGFQLRGALTLPPELSPMQIQGLPAHDPLRPLLERLLQAAGVTLSDTPQSAQSTLRITARDRQRQVLSVDQRGRAAEYALFEGVRFTLQQRDGERWGNEQALVVERSLLNLQEQLLGTQDQEELLREEMRRDLVGRMVRTLATLTTLTAP